MGRCAQLLLCATFVACGTSGATPDAHAPADATVDDASRPDATPDAGVADAVIVPPPDTAAMFDAPDASPDATPVPVCGNGIVEAGEQCDDHNSNNFDGCSNLCVLAGDVLLVSIDSAGNQGNGDSASLGSAISADGRYVAFASHANDLANHDSNGLADVFVHDTVANTTTCISVTPTGNSGNGPSSNPAMSADGRYVAFFSSASNLVINDDNGVTDIFVRDTMLGTTTRVSVDSSGAQADGGSSNPTITADGRFVGFLSSADNLVADDSNGQADAFVYDTVLATTTRVSVDSSGADADNASGTPVISVDGRYAAFVSSADNLFANDTDFGGNAFVRDSKTGVVTCVSVDSLGNPARGGSVTGNVVMTPDGRFIAFTSRTSTLVAEDDNSANDVFLRDTVARTTTLVSVNSAGAQGDAASSVDAISPDGRFVLFNSVADNLIDNDSNFAADEFVHDTFTGITTMISVSTTGQQGMGLADALASISADGQFVAFGDSANSFVVGDNNGQADMFRAENFPQQGVLARDSNGHTSEGGGTSDIAVTLGTQPTADVVVGVSSSNVAAATLSPASLTFTTDNWNIAQHVTVTGVEDSLATGDLAYFVEFALAQSDDPIYSGLATPSLPLTNLDDDIVRIVSVSSQQAPGDTGSGAVAASVSSDGRYVAFLSTARTFDDNAVDGQLHAFVRDTALDITTVVSIDATGAVQPVDADAPSISSDGRYVAFSTSTSLVAADTNALTDIYVRDTMLGTTTLVSIDAAGNQGNADATSPSISTDGNSIAFASAATNFASGGTNGFSQLYVRNISANTTTLVSATAAHVQGNGASTSPVLTPNGQFVAFTSTSTNFDAKGTSGGTDVYVHNLTANTTVRASVTSAAARGNGHSEAPTISANGRFVAFESVATNFIASDTNGVADIFLHDMSSGATTLVSVGPFGAQASEATDSPSISADGTRVVFHGNTDNFTTPANASQAPGILMRNISTTTTSIVHDSALTGVSGGDATSACITGDGSSVIYNSAASDVTNSDFNDVSDVFIAPTVPASP